MNRRADFIAEKIDRRRERASAKAERTARDLAIEAKARECANAFIGLNDAEQVSFAEHLIAHSWPVIAALVDPEAATTFLGKQAYEAGKGILPAAVARARADQALAKVGEGGGV